MNEKTKNKYRFRLRLATGQSNDERGERCNAKLNEMFYLRDVRQFTIC